MLTSIRVNLNCWKFFQTVILTWKVDYFIIAKHFFKRSRNRPWHLSLCFWPHILLFSLGIYFCYAWNIFSWSTQVSTYIFLLINILLCKALLKLIDELNSIKAALKYFKHFISGKYTNLVLTYLSIIMSSYLKRPTPN